MCARGKLSFQSMSALHIITLFLLSIALSLSSISLTFPFVPWSTLRTDTNDGTYCFQQSIGLFKAEQCSCDEKDVKCFDVDLNALPAGYDFYKLGGKVVMVLTMVGIGSLLGSISAVFMRGGANANNVRAHGYRNLKLFATVSCLYTAALYMVSLVLWSFYINNELNSGFSKQVKGTYTLGPGYYLGVSSFVFILCSSFLQMWIPEPPMEGYTKSFDGRARKNVAY